MILHIFNPENDLALADGGANYSPPPAACRIAYDLACLPLWFANPEDAVSLPDNIHHEYAKRMSQQFALATLYDSSLQDDITLCKPWGWSPQMYRRLQTSGFEKILPVRGKIDRTRELSNRKTTIDILKSLAERGIDIPELPRYCTQPGEVAEFINSRPRCVVKAPWSGSGKGIMWGIGRVETPMENFYRGVIKRQGGVVCESFLNSRAEFAMEFFAAENGISFAGYSLFNSFKGSYTGNMLATDSVIEERIAEFIPQEELRKLKQALVEVLQSLEVHKCYTGYLGVDMMIYDDNGKLRLNPCMELNLRMNMGIVARIFYDRHVVHGKEGRYFVSFFREEGEAYKEHCSNKRRYPLTISGSRISSGYVNLSPVTPASRYSVYAIIE